MVGKFIKSCLLVCFSVNIYLTKPSPFFCFYSIQVVMAPASFTSASKDTTNQYTPDVPSSNSSGGLTSFQIHFMVLFIIAFLCLILGIINLLIHNLNKKRRGKFRLKPNYGQYHPPTLSAAVDRRNGTGEYYNGNVKRGLTNIKFSQEYRNRSAKSERSRSLKSNKCNSVKYNRNRSARTKI